MKAMLLQPFHLSNLCLKNRMVMQPMVMNYADSRGFVTERNINYYAERAKGGAGLIIVESVCVARGGRVMANQMNIYEDTYIPGLRRLADTIHKGGAICFIQLQHGGRMALSHMNEGLQPVAPSPIPGWHYEIPREPTLAEIERLIGTFTASAARAKKAGFDGIELHFDHGYLPASFASPMTNKRSDRYGGSLEGRARFDIEIVQSIRQQLGEEFLIGVRLCVVEELTGGLPLREGKQLAQMLEASGTNLFNISSGYRSITEEGYLATRVATSPLPMSFPRGHFIPFAHEVKQVIKSPVIGVGRLDDFDLAERVLTEGKADLIGIGRGFLADPTIAAKFKAGRPDEVRRCIACNTCQITLRTPLSPQLGGVSCAVNPEMGREAELRLKPVTKAKKVVIIGGGPAGMEAARVARLRGHDVTLIEKKPYLGGTLIIASLPWYKKDIRYVVDFLSAQIDKLGVNVMLNAEANADSILSFKPDVVILASGASPVRPQIPGIEKETVTDIAEVLEGKKNIGHRVVVVGAGLSGCETAAFLTEKGKEVTLVTRRNSDYGDGVGLAPDMEPQLRKWFIFELWANLPVRVVSNAVFKRVTASGLTVTDRDNKEKLIEADTIVFGVGMQPNNQLAAALKGKVAKLHVVGDAREPRKIANAIHEGAEAGRLA